jgi:beta-N-acetylhexosaminidase
MTAHVIHPSLGSEPATINPEALRLLREELGFEGAIVSDALEMRAVAELVGPEEAAVRALEAGVDLLCLGHDLPFDPVYAAVAKALLSGRISRARIGEATSRIDRIRSAVAPANGAPGTSLGAEAARRAIRVDGEARVEGVPLVVELVPSPNIAAGPRARWLAEVVGRRWPESEVRRVGPDDDAPDVDGRPLVVVMQDAGRHDWQRRIVASLARPDTVVLETGLPAWTPGGVAGVVATHGAGRASLEAAFDVLAGRD